MVIVLFVIAESKPEDFVELIWKEVDRYHQNFGLQDHLKSKDQFREEIKKLMKENGVSESPAKVGWAYDYLTKCITTLEDEALKTYNALV